MIASKDQDKCNSCVYKYNELLGNPFPCNICQGFNEYIPADEDTPTEAFWLDDPITVKHIIDTIDDVCWKLEALDDILMNHHIAEHTYDTTGYLNAIKRTIAEVYSKKYEDRDRAWFETDTDYDPDDLPF